jgi:hypothetical protein
MKHLKLASALFSLALTTTGFAGGDPYLWTRLQSNGPQKASIILQVNGAPGSQFTLFIGLPGPPVSFPFGTLRLQTMIMPIYTGQIGTQGATAVQLTLPRWVTLGKQLGIGFQGLVITPGREALLTNGVFFANWTEDHDRDGKDDRRFLDVDGDGKLDVAVVDHDEDGVPEELWYDRNKDGKFDEVRYDKNEDGKFESGKFDTNFDDKFDRKWVDKNEDGRIGSAEMVELLPVEDINAPAPFHEPPCVGAVKIAEWLAWEDVGNTRFSLIQTVVWRCPDRSEKTKRRLIL